MNRRADPNRGWLRRELRAMAAELAAMRARIDELEDLHPELGFPYPPDADSDDELAAAGSPTSDRAGAGQGQAPEGTSGDAAARIHGPANACPPAQRVLRDAPSPSSVAPQDDRDDEESAAEFAARVAAASAKRAEILRKPEPVDWSRVARAHERKAATPRPVVAARPLQPADSPEECRRCGIPGRKGCAHQLAYVEQPIVESPYSMGKRRAYG